MATHYEQNEEIRIEREIRTRLFYCVQAIGTRTGRVVGGLPEMLPVTSQCQSPNEEG